MDLSLAMSGLPGERIDCPAPLKLFESLPESGYTSGSDIFAAFDDSWLAS